MDHFVNELVRWLSHPFFEFVVLPVLITFLAMLFKCMVRGGPTLNLNREDLLVGFDLGVTALLTLVASTVKAGERFSSLRTQLQQTAPDNSGLTNTLSIRSQAALDYLIAAPTFTFFVFISLLGLALFASQNAWEVAGGTKGPMKKPWIFACDLIGFLFLGGALALGGLIR